jgi:hypothetical protein
MWSRIITWGSVALIAGGAGYGIYRFVTWDTAYFYAAADMLEEQRAAAKAEGLAMVPDDLRPATPIPDDQNAAVDYKALITGLRSKGIGMSFQKPLEDWSRDPTLSNLAAAKATLARFSAVVARLHKAAAKPHCDYERRYEDGPLLLLPEYADMKAFVKLLVAKARIDAYDGKIDEAMQALDSARQICIHAGDEPLLIGMLVRLGGEAIVMRSIEVLLSTKPHDKELMAHLESFLKGWPGPPDIRKAMSGGLVESTIVVRKYSFEQIQEFGGLFSDEDVKKHKAIRIDPEVRRQAYEARLIQAWRIVHEELRRHKNPAAGTAAAEKRIAAMEASKDPTNFLVAIMVPVFSQSGQAIVKRNFMPQLLLAKMQLMRFYKERGRFPVGMEELTKPAIDPFSRKPLIYEGHKDKFFLRSVGYNGVDDGHRLDDIRVEHPLDPMRDIKR